MRLDFSKVATASTPRPMTKRVFCLAGWGDLPKKQWWPSLCSTLTQNGHTVILATKPVKDRHIQQHVNNLAGLVDANGGLGPDCIFIGHSVRLPSNDCSLHAISASRPAPTKLQTQIGQALIMRYLASRPSDVNVTICGVVAIGAWVDLPSGSQAIFGKKVIGPWLVPYTAAETERQKSLIGKMLIFIGSNDHIVGGGFGNCGPSCGLGFKPGVHEESLKKFYPWATIHITKRGHYIVNSFKDGEIDEILKLAGPQG